MPSWDTPFTSPLRFNAVTGAAGAYRMLWEAADERWRAHFGDCATRTVLPAWPPLPVAGDAVNDSSVIGGNTPTLLGYDWLGLQGSVAQMLLDRLWLDHRAPTAGAAGVTRWTIPAVRAAAGLPATKLYWWDESGLVTDAAYDNQLWLRKAERVIGDPMATTDLYGNPAVAGQRARCNYFGPPGPPGYLFGWAYGSRVYECVAPGNWQKAAVGTSPDVLSNDADPPDCLPGNDPGVLADYGQCRKHDIIGGPLGLHVWEELRAVLDLMRWTGLTVADGNVFAGWPHWFCFTRRRVTRGGAGGGSYQASLAAAQADLDATWAGLADDDSGDLDYPTTDDLNFDGPDRPWAFSHVIASERFAGSVGWSGAHRRKLKLWVPGLDPALARKAEWYASGAAYGGGTFDANGDPVGDGVLVAFDASGPNTGTDETSDWLGDTGTAPVLHDPTGVGDRYSGYDAPDQASAVPDPRDDPRRPVVVLKWNVGAVNGGFVHCSATD